MPARNAVNPGGLGAEPHKRYRKDWVRARFRLLWAMGTDSTVGGEDREVLRRFLPAGWEEEARRSGALRRARGVDGAESLLAGR